MLSDSKKMFSFKLKKKLKRKMKLVNKGNIPCKQIMQMKIVLFYRIWLGQTLTYKLHLKCSRCDEPYTFNDYDEAW